jgi:hypothetical protein
MVSWESIEVAADLRAAEIWLATTRSDAELSRSKRYPLRRREVCAAGGNIKLHAGGDGRSKFVAEGE